MLVLKAWIVTFGGRLVENARFGSLHCHFWWKSRGKCSFWNLGLPLLAKVSWKMLVLEAWIVTLGEISWCAARVSCKSFAQECQGRVFRKECQERVSSKSVQQDCLARVSCQECPAGVSSKSVKNKSVKKECLGTLHYININITLHCFALHYITLHTSHYITFTLHYITLHYIT